MKKRVKTDFFSLNDSEWKDYPGSELERRKKWRQLFLECLIGNAEKGTYDKGYMEKEKKLILPCEDLVISTLVRKLRVTQRQTSLDFMAEAKC